MKTFFRVLAALSGLFAGFDLVEAGVAYAREPSVTPVFWLVTAAISFFLGGALCHGQPETVMRAREIRANLSSAISRTSAADRGFA